MASFLSEGTLLSTSVRDKGMQGLHIIGSSELKMRDSTSVQHNNSRKSGSCFRTAERQEVGVLVSGRPTRITVAWHGLNTTVASE